MGGTILKKSVWNGLAGAYRWSGVSRLRHKDRAVILTYHRVLTARDLAVQVVQPGMYVRDEVFEMHVAYLKKHFFVLSFAELLERWQTGRWDRAKAYCVITFDDGWIDNYRNAYPILKSAGLPATIFLPTDFIGTIRWFWPERLGYLLRKTDAPGISTEQRRRFYSLMSTDLREVVGQCGAKLYDPENRQRVSHDQIIEIFKALDHERLERLLAKLTDISGGRVPESRVLMNWDEVRELSDQGMSFGSHSCSHRLLTLLSETEVLAEAASSYERLRESGATTIPVFCYPNGNYNDSIKQAVKKAGYQAAVSCDRGDEGRCPADMLALRRISMHHDISNTPSLFALALAGAR